MAKSFLSDNSNLNLVLNPIEESKGLPNQHYISEDIFQKEKSAVLFNNWSGLDFAKNIPKAGDAKPVEFLGIPLLIVRDRDGSIGVFQNTCRHRGMILIDKPTKIRGVITCPYHGWCYGTKGDLRATPHVGGPNISSHAAIKNDKLGLFQIRSYVWKDIIFINLSGDAPEFDDYASKLIDRWKEFDQPMFHGGEDSSLVLDVNCNWKLAVENYSESYHLPWIHPGLNTYSRIEDHYNILEKDCFSGQGTNVYQQYVGEGEIKFPDFSGLSSQWNQGAEYITIFPNVMLGIHRDHFFGIILEARGCDNTREHVEFYYAEDIQHDPKFDLMLKNNAERWRTVFLEDVSVVEGMQKGRQGTMFDGGAFSPVLDNGTHCFHQWVASQMVKNGKQSLDVD